MSDLTLTVWDDPGHPRCLVLVPGRCGEPAIGQVSHRRDGRHEARSGGPRRGCALDRTRPPPRPSRSHRDLQASRRNVVHLRPRRPRSHLHPKSPDGVERGVFHEQNHHGGRQHLRQYGILEAVGEIFRLYISASLRNVTGSARKGTAPDCPSKCLADNTVAARSATKISACPASRAAGEIVQSFQGVRRRLVVLKGPAMSSARHGRPSST
jgi:hypothetical protein